MKAFARFLLVVLLTVAASAAEPALDDMKLFLLIGQSNMAGRGVIGPDEKVPHARVFALNKDMQWVPAVDPLHWDKPAIVGVGPGIAFGRSIADADKTTVVGLIPAAFGGSSLEQWAPGGEHYAHAIARAKVAMRHGRLAGILWHQGESDSAPALVATYTERFARMIAQLRADLGAPGVPVVVGEVGRFREKDASVAINAVLARLPAHVPNCAFVSAEGLKDRGDKLHFDTASQHELGRRYAAAWLSLAK